MEEILKNLKRTITFDENSLETVDELWGLVKEGAKIEVILHRCEEETKVELEATLDEVKRSDIKSIIRGRTYIILTDGRHGKVLMERNGSFYVSEIGWTDRNNIGKEVT